MEKLKTKKSPQEKTKVQALAERIIEECQRQNFAVGEVEFLIDALSFALDNRIDRLKHELF